MRVYFTTDIAGTRTILKDGFTDIHVFGDARGVYVGKRPLEINDGFAGNVVLCLVIPDELFNENEEIECPDDAPEWRTGRSLIPAAVLNQHGPAQIYDHFYAGLTRKDLLTAIRRWSEEGEEQRVAEMQSAYDWFDEIGWLTPLRVREERLLESGS